MRDLIEDFQDWLATVPPEVLFLMLLPAAIAVAGLWAVRGEWASKTGAKPADTMPREGTANRSHQMAA